MTPRGAREEATVDIGNTVNATEPARPVWGSRLRILGIPLPLAAGLVCSFIDRSRFAAAGLSSSAPTVQLAARPRLAALRCRVTAPA